MPGSRPIAVLTALSLALAALDAWARPTVMVWPGDRGAPVFEAEAELRAGGVALVPRAQVAEAIATARAEEAGRERARQESIEVALTNARDHYLALELDLMLEVLREAEPAAVASARPERCDGLWELQFRWGLALGARAAAEAGAQTGAQVGVGHDAAAEDRYSLAIELDPSRRPPHELYGPDVTGAFLRVVEAHSRRVARAVPLRVQPADARVEIDCRVVEDERASLRPGLHAVRVSAPGHRAWSAVVDSRSLEALEVALVALPEDHDPARRLGTSTEHDEVDDDSTSAHAAVLALARAQGAAAVLVVGTAPDGWRVRPWGRDGIGAAVERASLGEALEAAMALLDDDGRLRAPAPVVVPEPTGGEPDGGTRRPVVRTWWFWTAVGTAAATAVAVGLGVGLSRGEAPPGRLVIVAR